MNLPRKLTEEEVKLVLEVRAKIQDLHKQAEKAQDDLYDKLNIPSVEEDRAGYYDWDFLWDFIYNSSEEDECYVIEEGDIKWRVIEDGEVV